MTTDSLTMTAPSTTEVEKPRPIKKICFILSKSNMASVYGAMVMANGARMEGIEAELFFTFFGLDAINLKKMNSIHEPTLGNASMPMPAMIAGLPGMEAFVTSQMKKEMEKLDLPPVDEFMEMIHLSGGKFFACHLAMEMFKLKEEDVVDYLDGILTIGEFYERAAGEGTHIIFI